MCKTEIFSSLIAPDFLFGYSTPEKLSTIIPHPFRIYPTSYQVRPFFALAVSSIFFCFSTTGFGNVDNPFVILTTALLPEICLSCYAAIE